VYVIWGTTSRPEAIEWLAIALGSVGTLEMVTGDDLRARPLGTILILIAIASWSLGTVALKRARVL